MTTISWLIQRVKKFCLAFLVLLRPNTATYFNGFSIEKWKKYTILDRLTLRLEMAGKFRVILLSKEKVHNEIFEKIICAATIETDTRQVFEFSFADGNDKGMYTFGLEALSDNSIFYGGAYCSKIAKDAVRDVKIGIGICTFRREEFVRKNLKILKLYPRGRLPSLPDTSVWLIFLRRLLQAISPPSTRVG